MKTKKILNIFFMIAILTCITSCSSKDNVTDNNIKEKNNEEYNYFQDIVLKNEEEAVYNMYGAYLGIYNTKNKTYNSKYKNSASIYLGEKETDIFTIGSNENKFSIVKDEGRVLKKIYDIPQQDAIYPIGKYKDDYYFVYCVDDASEKVNRNIVKYDENKQKLQTILETHDENIINWIFVDDNLYFNVYDMEGEFYDLYAYNMNTGKRKLIKEKMKSEKIYEYKGKLLYEATEHELRSLDEKESYDVEKNIGSNRLEGKYGLLFQIYISDGAECECIVTQLSNQNKLATVEGFIGYKIEDNVLKMYSNEEVKTITLESIE